MKNRRYITFIFSVFLIALVFTIFVIKNILAYDKEVKVIGDKAARESNYIVDTTIVGTTYKTPAICSYDYSDLFIGRGTDTNGLMYRVIDPPECERGEKVTLVLDTMNTEEIYDDKVVAIEFENN